MSAAQATTAAATIISLADQAASADPSVAKVARQNMERRVHEALKPATGSNKPDKTTRAAVADTLAAIARATSRPRAVRARAVYLLGFAGDGGAGDRALAALESDPEIGEDARMARQRLRAVRY